MACYLVRHSFLELYLKVPYLSKYFDRAGRLNEHLFNANFDCDSEAEWGLIQNALQLGTKAYACTLAQKVHGAVLTIEDDTDSFNFM